MSEGALVAEAAPAGGGELRARDERVAVDVAALVAVFAQTLAPEETRAKVRGGLGGGGGGGAGAPGGSASGALSLGSVAAVLAGGVRGGISGAPRRGGEGAVAAEGGGARWGGHGAPAAAGPTGEQGAVRAARRGRRRGRIWRVSGPRPRRRLGGSSPSSPSSSPIARGPSRRRWTLDRTRSARAADARDACGGAESARRDFPEVERATGTDAPRGG